MQIQNSISKPNQSAFNSNALTFNTHTRDFKIEIKPSHVFKPESSSEWPSIGQTSSNVTSSPCIMSCHNKT